MMLSAILCALLANQETDAKKAEAALLERETAAATPADRIKIAEDWTKAAQKFPKEKKRFEDKAMAAYEKAWGEMDDAGKAKFRPQALKMARVPDDFSAFRKGQPTPPGWEGFSENQGSCPEDKAAFTGSRCGKLTKWAKDNKAGNSWITSLKLKTKPGNEYTASARVFSDRADAPANFEIRFHDVNGMLLNATGPILDGDLPFWKKVDAKAKAPDLAVWVDISFPSRLTTGFFLVDDVSLMLDGKELLTNGGFEKK